MESLPALGAVALLIDFENLVRGLVERHGRNAVDQLDPEPLFRLAEEYGHVVLAQAYADWRMRDVNQFQADLYGHGIELVHVFGKGYNDRFKNAVDVKMAVDAVEALFTLPHVRTFVIVSGDRDFIHVLKMLRRHGRTVVGVSPAGSEAEDFATLCDRFVRYDALVSSYTHGDVATADLAPVREALLQMFEEYPSGVMGSMVKQHLRRILSPTFDESEFGYAKLSSLLRDLPEVVRLTPDPRGGGDVVALPSAGQDSPAGGLAPAPISPLIPKVLRDYRFEQDVDRRRHILSALHAALSNGTMTWDEVVAEVGGALNSPISATILNKYRSILLQSQAVMFDPEPDVPTRERIYVLSDPAFGGEDFIRAYERSVTYKMVTMEAGDDVTPKGLSTILGMDSEDEDALAYAAALLQEASGIVSDADRPVPAEGE